jgi:hypothetical protein
MSQIIQVNYGKLLGEHLSEEEKNLAGVCKGSDLAVITFQVVERENQLSRTQTSCVSARFSHVSASH